MRKEELYLNENACEILIDIPSLIPLINLIGKWNQCNRLETQITIGNDEKNAHVYDVEYIEDQHIRISCDDGRELIIKSLASNIIPLSVSYKLSDNNYITYTFHIINTFDNSLKSLTSNQLEIEEISYKNHKFKKSLIPLKIVEDKRHIEPNKYFSYGELGINVYTLKPILYGDWLPKYEDILSFNAEDEKMKIEGIIKSNDSKLNVTTVGLLRGLEKSLITCENTYKNIIKKYTEWQEKMEEHKELINALFNKVFSPEELQELAKSIEIKLDDENAVRLLKQLSPGLVEAVKRQLHSK